LQISTILALTGSLACVGLFTQQRRWLLVIGYFCSATYTLLDKIVKPAFLPETIVDLFAYLFAIFLAWEFARMLRAKRRPQN